MGSDSTAHEAEGHEGERNNAPFIEYVATPLSPADNIDSVCTLLKSYFSSLSAVPSLDYFNADSTILKETKSIMPHSLVL